MRRVKSLSVVLLLSMLSPSLAQPQKIKPVTVTDPAAVLSRLRGEVFMLGETFPNRAFQQGVVGLLQSRVISKLTVLTTAEHAASYRSLKTLGASVFYLPAQGIKMTGNAVFAGDDTIILQTTPNRWTMMQAAQMGAQGRASMTLYLKAAKRL
jgi:hypothetical protein